MKKRNPKSGLAALLVPAALSAQTAPETALPSHYELWKELMEGIHKNYQAPLTAGDAASRDSDGDGKSDLQEAHDFTDPLVQDRELTPEERIAQQQAQAEQARQAAVSRGARQASARAFAAPWLEASVVLEALEPGRELSPEGRREAKRQRLAESLPALRAESETKIREARRLAKQMGMPEEFRYPHGGGAALSGEIVDGVPQYVTTLNLNAAKTIAVDKLWPGGPLNLDLQGGFVSDPGASGGGDEFIVPRVRLGVWEVFKPLLTHQAFGRYAPALPVTQATSRVTQKDGAPVNPERHATHVIGTIASRGLTSNTKGMAPYAEVHSRDIDSYIAEMTTIFAAGAEKANQFFVSNHSYAQPLGWTDVFYPAPTALPGPGRYWNTNSAISEEDYRYGAYTQAESSAVDNLVYRSESLLPVWAAGNERFDVAIPDYPEPFWHWEYAAGYPNNRKWVNTPRRQDHYWNSGYDTLFPEAVAKNVLTVTSINDVPGGWTSSSSAESSWFASWGPPDYGHIKPDVAANGEDLESTIEDGGYDYLFGTSMAAPTVTGTLGLLVELLQRQYGEDYEPHAALLKALIIAGTDDLGPVGPDYRHGWGQVNARKSAHLIALNAASGGQHIRRVMVQNGVSGSFIVKAKGGEPLIVTAVWLDLPGYVSAPILDPAGTLPTVNQSLSVLKNDIDLKVTRSTTTWHPPSLSAANFTSLPPGTTKPNTYGVATYSGPNHRDTVEKIIIPQPGATPTNPTAGHEYTVTFGPAPGVTLRNELGQAAPQELFLVISGIQPQGTQPFQIVWFEETADDQVTLLWPAVPGATYWVQGSNTLANGSWTDIPGSNITATQPYAAKTVAKPVQAQRFYRIRKAS